METMEYVAGNGGGGLVIIVVGIFVIIKIAKATWSGTLSEDAQRRNRRRRKQ